MIWRAPTKTGPRHAVSAVQDSARNGVIQISQRCARDAAIELVDVDECSARTFENRGREYIRQKLKNLDIHDFCGHEDYTVPENQRCDVYALDAVDTVMGALTWYVKVHIESDGTVVLDSFHRQRAGRALKRWSP